MDPIPPEQLAALAKEDLGPLTKSIVIVFTAIAFIAVCLRIFTRLRFIGRQLGWEVSNDRKLLQRTFPNKILGL